MHMKRLLVPARDNTLQPGESGQALIETAISVALLVIFILGIAEIGRLAYAAIEVTSAAKAAAQYAAQNHAAADNTAGIQAAAAAAAPTLSNLTATPAYSYTCSYEGQPTTGAPGSCPGSQIVETVNIQTSASFDPLIHLPGLPTLFTLHGQAVQQVLSND